MKKLLKSLFIITLPTLIILFLLLEIVFRHVLPASDPPQNYFDEKALIFNYLPGQPDGRTSVGGLARLRARYHINNYGWNSPVDYHEEKTVKRIAVIGDSYVDALQVDAEESYPSRLREFLGGRYEVYSFGMSGAPLSQYLHLSRYVDKLFAPDILIFNVVMNDFDESIAGVRPFIHFLTLKIDGDTAREIPPRIDYSHSYYNPRKRMLKKSAVVRYLFHNIKLKPTLGRVFSRKNTVYADNTELSGVQRNRDKINLVADYVVSRVKAENPGKKILFVVDGARNSIYSDELDKYGLEFLHRTMRETCARHDISLLDLTDPMYRDYRTRGRMFNSKYDYHWNEYGHEFVARQVLRWINEADR
ncbi:MAG: hypothetical protein JXB45_10695 [Candidatus Krumholzibacteriota bacterium]|nr:hypothetical protein [Candidatus Krumholzibacteriota bacterium]